MAIELSVIENYFSKYGTDKLSHGYANFYSSNLPRHPKKILEIGVKSGNSIRAWKEIFPNTILHALDLFMEYPIPDIEGVVWHKGNQADHLLLEQLRKEDFDIIIDDGSHLSRHQMMTFYGLFNGKHYYIEDIHCADEEFYRDGLPVNVTVKYLSWPFVEVVYDCQSPIVLIKSE